VAQLKALMRERFEQRNAKLNESGVIIPGQKPANPETVVPSTRNAVPAVLIRAVPTIDTAPAVSSVRAVEPPGRRWIDRPAPLVT
jgi:hypothetical protein